VCLSIAAAIALSACGSKSSTSTSSDGGSGATQITAANLKGFCQAKDNASAAIGKLASIKQTSDTKYTASATEAMTRIGQSIGLLNATISKASADQRQQIAEANIKFRNAYSQYAPKINQALALERYKEVKPLVDKLYAAFNSAYAGLHCN
jgi:hypothetical protein